MTPSSAASPGEAPQLTQRQVEASPVNHILAGLAKAHCDLCSVHGKDEEGKVLIGIDAQEWHFVGDEEGGDSEVSCAKCLRLRAWRWHHHLPVSM
jgi:hypothetical protein